MLSSLQRYILLELFVAKSGTPEDFLKFYRKQKQPPKETGRLTIISRSIERLVERGFCVTHGKRTKEKWFIDQVKLTPQGRKKTQQLIKEKQLSLIS